MKNAFGPTFQRCLEVVHNPTNILGHKHRARAIGLSGHPTYARQAARHMPVGLAPIARQSPAICQYRGTWGSR